MNNEEFFKSLEDKIVDHLQTQGVKDIKDFVGSTIMFSIGLLIKSVFSLGLSKEDSLEAAEAVCGDIMTNVKNRYDDNLNIRGLAAVVSILMHKKGDVDE